MATKSLETNGSDVVGAAPDAGRPLDLGRHLPTLDGVRGLAVLMVLLFHFVGGVQPTNTFEQIVVRATNYGSYGVELFFVLSGFLITGILYDSRESPRYFQNFYMRRVLRIFPLYYGVLILVFLVAPLVPMLRGPTLDTLLDRQAWAWLYAVNVHIALAGDWSFSYLQHFWSLAIEEHFYLFWPFVVFALVGRPRLLIAVSLGVAVAAFAGRILGLSAGMSWWTTYVLTPFRLDGLALGAAMAVIVRQRGGLAYLLHAMPRVVLVAGGLFVASFAWSRFAGQGDVYVMAFRAGLIQVLLACLLLWAITAPERSLASKVFSSRALTFLGTYSYGLYVYHHFISYYFSVNKTELVVAGWIGSHTAAIALQAVAGMGASLVIAYLSYEYFEKRFLDMKRHFSAHATIDQIPANLSSAPRARGGEQQKAISVPVAGE
ncbi:MAG: acyltransferase [Hyphomicrobiaceae bacterium]|nr:acyltransferase [Hyphomicrobiaceae bacterium]